MLIQNATVPMADTTFEDALQALRGQDPVSFVLHLAHTYGDIVRVPFGTRDIYLLNHPDFIQNVFVNESGSFAKRKNAETEKTYLNQIAGMVPIFQKDLTATHAPEMIEASENVNARWQSIYQQTGTLTVDIYTEMMRATVPIVCKTLFNADVEAESANIVDALRTMDVGYGFDTIAAILGDTVPRVEVSMTPQMLEARAYLLNLMRRLIDAYRATPQESESLLSGLLKLQMSDEQFAEIALVTFCAMHEITATTLPWTWYLLSQYPEVEAQLHTELATVLEGRTPGFEDLPNLVYTQMILKEGRRLYPSVWIVGRFVRDDVSFSGYVVPAGSIVLLGQRVMHRDARYFPNPDEFDPLRWTPEAVAARPEFTYFPFSVGSRKCIGRDFAEAEDALILATLAQHWQARLVPGQVLEPHPQKSFAPRNGIKMTLHRR
jgi:cytochrome P450